MYLQSLLCLYCEVQMGFLRAIVESADARLLYYTILYYTILFYTTLHYSILYYTTLHYNILCYTILYYAILYYTILYYTILYYRLVLTSSWRLHPGGTQAVNRALETSITIAITIVVTITTTIHRLIITTFTKESCGLAPVMDSTETSQDVYTCMCIYIYIYVYIHAYIHAYIHTYIHTYIMRHTVYSIYVYMCVYHGNLPGRRPRGADLALAGRPSRRGRQYY